MTWWEWAIAAGVWLVVSVITSLIVGGILQRRDEQ